MVMILIAGCARRSSPSGGEEDSIPPVLIASNPKINTVNFDANEIVVKCVFLGFFLEVKNH